MATNNSSSSDGAICNEQKYGQSNVQTAIQRIMNFWIVSEGHDTDSLSSLSLPHGSCTSLSGWFCPQNDSNLGGTINWKFVGDYSASLPHDLRSKMIFQHPEMLFAQVLYRGVDERTADLMLISTVLRILANFALMSTTVLLVSISLNLSPTSPRFCSFNSCHIVIDITFHQTAK